MALTANPTTLTVSSGAPTGTFNIVEAQYTGRFTASSSDQTKVRVFAKGPVIGASTGASKEAFGPTADFVAQWIASGSATITVTDDAGNTATCTVTAS